MIVSDKHKDTQAGSLEILGHYDPTKKPKTIELKTERILYWIDKGAQPSASVNNLLINQGIIKGDKQKSVSITNKRAKKMGDTKAKALEAEEAAKAKAAKAVEDAKAAEEAAKVAAAEAEAVAPQSGVAEPAPAVEAPAETPVEAPTETPAEEAPTV